MSRLTLKNTTRRVNIIRTITYENGNVGCSSPVTQFLGQIVDVAHMQTWILEDLYSWVLIKVYRENLPVCGILVYELD